MKTISLAGDLSTLFCESSSDVLVRATNTHEEKQAWQKALFISDTHLFNPHTSAFHMQAALIEQIAAENIFYVGDIIDFERIHIILRNLHKKGEIKNIPDSFPQFLMAMEKHIPESAQLFERNLRFIDLINFKSSQGIKQHYVYGNHDKNLGLLDGSVLNGVYISDSIVRRFGQQTAFIDHGDKNDNGCQINYKGWMHHSLSAIIHGAIEFDIHREDSRRRHPETLGMHDEREFKLTDAMKYLAGKFMKPFHERSSLRALQHGATISINGHTHMGGIHTHQVKQKAYQFRDICRGTPLAHAFQDDHPMADRTLDVKYLNCGDGFSSGTGVLFDPTRSDSEQWMFLSGRDFLPSLSFNAKSLNPYEIYRQQTMQTMQAFWETYKAYASLENDWDHIGSLVAKPNPRIPKDKSEAAYQMLTYLYQIESDDRMMKYSPAGKGKQNYNQFKEAALQML